MIERPENITVVIPSDEEAKDISVRHSLRCIGRDCRFLCRALARHCREYGCTYTRGWSYTNCWWMRRQRDPSKE
jgi:hypothetical protein